MYNKEIIDRISREHSAEKEDILTILQDDSEDMYLFEEADKIRKQNYGTDVYLRGLIEISNYCKNNCLYCGIRRDNRKITRYRLTEQDILLCCDTGYELGFRTFVLQGGEDIYFNDDFLCSIIHKIKAKYPDCAVTLSLGERTEKSYIALFSAGADRYLLRHETASKSHYEKLHPAEMSFDNRIECLKTLKKIGFQTGAGFMVGSPFQSHDNLAEDLMFIKNLKPEMVGIGPFISHNETPFKEYKNGTLRDTLVMVALTRLILPNALIPSTTALGTIDPHGREKGLKAGANVVMPNLSPVKFRKLYSLYDNKICMGDEAAECRQCLEKRVESAGYKIVTDRGDWHA